MLFFWGGRFSPFWILLFSGKSSFWSILRLCKFIQNGRNTNFTKKWKHDLYGQFPMEFKVLKLWKSSTWPKIGIIRRASVSTLEQMYHLGKNEKSEASFYWDSPYVCVWREALELECLTFYCLTGRWMFYHCSLEWSAPFLIFRQCVIHLWWAMLRLIYRIQYAANRRRQ